MVCEGMKRGLPVVFQLAPFTSFSDGPLLPMAEQNLSVSLRGLSERIYPLLPGNQPYRPTNVQDKRDA